MDPELKKLLEENHALARDNHHLLRAIRRHQLIGAYWKVFFWLFLLGGAYFGYQEYLKPLADTFAANRTPGSGPFGLPTSAEIQKLIDSYKAGQK